MEGERVDAISRIRSGPLSDAGRLKKYMMVRKGKALLVRALRLLDEENMKVCVNIQTVFYPKYAKTSPTNEGGGAWVVNYITAGILRCVKPSTSGFLQHVIFTLCISCKERPG